MKNLILILLCLPVIAFGQSPNTWESHEFGNAFDGFNRTAFIFNNEGFMLAVTNTSNKILLDCGESYGGESGDYLQNNTSIIVSNSFVPSTVLISFDDENEYYKTVFRDRNVESENKYAVQITELISSDYSKLYLKDFFINKLKQHSKINFRFLNKTIKKDISFTLKGSTDAINKTVKYPKCNDALLGVVRIALTLNILFTDQSKFNNTSYYFDTVDILNKITSNFGWLHPYAYAYRSYKYSDSPKYLISFFNDNNEKVGEFKYVFPQKYDCKENAQKFGFKICQSATEEEINNEEYTDLINSVNGSKFLFDQFVKQGYDKSEEEFIILMNISL